jgi:hypothetical protein
MSEKPISPLRRRMLNDMNVRRLGPTLRRQVHSRQRTPPAARVASGSGHNRPPTLFRAHRISV